jgi:acyl carrier protein
MGSNNYNLLNMITLEEFTLQLEEELEDLPKGTLKSDADYHKMDWWNSMYALLIIAFVDANFNVTLNGEDLRNTKTVRQLYELVSSRLNAAS